MSPPNKTQKIGSLTEEERRLRRNASSRKSKQKKREQLLSTQKEPKSESSIPLAEDNQICSTTIEYMNPHSEYINKQIIAVKNSKKWNTKIINTSHDDFVKDFSATVFTNFIKDIITKTYMRGKICEDCNETPAENRCHGLGDERPKLIRKALQRVYPDITKEISLKEILIAFLEEHRTTRFALKCKVCHDKEGRPK
jgi:hypothetical protein